MAKSQFNLLTKIAGFNNELCFFYDEQYRDKLISVLLTSIRTFPIFKRSDRHSLPFLFPIYHLQTQSWQKAGANMKEIKKGL